MPLSRALALFEEYRLSNGLAPKTVQEYRAAMKHIRTLPDSPTAAEVAGWWRDLGQRFSAQYCNTALCVLRQASKLAAELGEDTGLAVAVARVRSYNLPVRGRRCPPQDFYARALELCHGRAEQLWVKLACRCGLRKGELLGLRPGDWQPPVLHVVRQRTRPHRKNRRPHSVNLEAEPDIIADLEWTLANAKAIQSPAARFAGLAGVWVFPWGKDGAQGFVDRLRRDLPAGYLPAGTGWHACRHWGASELARRGASVWDIQRWLGDADPGVASGYIDEVRGATRAAPIGCARVGEPSGDRGIEPDAGGNPRRALGCATTVDAVLTWSDQ